MARRAVVSNLTAGIVVAFCLMAAPDRLNAASINYTATETDATLNIWRYDYIVSGVSFGISAAYTASGFDILFDPNLYSNLDPLPNPPNNDWFVLTAPADPVLPANGAYTAQAVVDGASLASPFSISFTWLGRGSPGVQPFDVFDPNFLIVQQGSTVGVPGPVAGAGLIPGLAFGALVFRLHRRRRGPATGCCA